MTLDKYTQGKPYLLHKPTGAYDGHGFRVFSLQLISNGKIVDQIKTISGAPAAQKRELVSPEKDFSKSGNPIPEGIYKIGSIIQMSTLERGVGFVKIPIDVLSDFKVNNRGEFLFHNDQNKATAPGSLGCIVTNTLSDMGRIVSWCSQKARPTVLIADYGKSLLTKRGVIINGFSPTFAATAAPVSSGKQKMNTAGLNLLKDAEGLRLTAYKCSANVDTIGFGSTKDVKPGMKITQIEAEEMLRRDLAEFEAAVDKLVVVPLNDNQFSALVSIFYNCGSTAMANSTLLKLLNKSDYVGAGKQFLVWNKGGGKVLEGLTRRRKAEQALFLS